MSDIEPEISVEEIIQDTPDDPLMHVHSVPVVVRGPVRISELGSRVQSMRMFTVTTASQNLLGEDFRRRRAVILSVDLPVYVGSSPTEVDGGYAFLLPERVPLEIKHTDPIFVAVAGVSGTSKVSIEVEEWAE